ncbi:MAG: DMT family transporter [Desulfamplus sp.]|nr:DMT family transporter [Desulfamplus sp.]
MSRRRWILLNTVFLISVAVIGGLFVTIQAQFMGVLDKNIGTIESVFITYGGGGLCVGVVMLLLRGGNLGAFQTVPLYVLSSGIAGLVIVGSIGFVTPRLGLVPASTLLVAAQFISAALIDHFGLLGADVRLLTPSRICGMGVMMAGIWLIIRS